MTFITILGTDTRKIIIKATHRSISIMLRWVNSKRFEWMADKEVATEYFRMTKFTGIYMEMAFFRYLVCVWFAYGDGKWQPQPVEIF